MTNYIKKMMLTMAFGLALVTPTLAADCSIATKEAAQTMLEENHIAHRMLTKSEADALFAAKGNPPNAVEGTPLEAELVYTDEFAGVNIYQDGCFINKLGPSAKFIIFQLLGITEARLSI